MTIKKPAITKTLALRIQVVASVKLDTNQPARLISVTTRMPNRTFR